jgi:hypothetical protein
VPEEYFTGGGSIGYIALSGQLFQQGPAVYASAYAVDVQSDKNEVISGPLHALGHQSELLYANEPRASGVAVVSNMIFWGTSSGLSFGPEAGNANVNRVPTAGPVTGVAADKEQTAYFVVGDRSIYCLMRGSDTPELIYEATSDFGPSDIALDDTWLYWSEHDNERLMRMKR